MANCSVRHCGNASRNVYSLNSNVSQLANDSAAAMFVKANLSPVEAFKLGLEVLVALFGVVGNALVAIVISRMGKKKKPADVYLLNLAIADLGILLLSFPLGAIREKAPLKWPLGEFTCIYLYPITEIFHGASVWCIAVIAVERYRKIVTLQPKRDNRKMTSLRIPKIIVGLVWVVSFCICCFPLYFVVEYVELTTGVGKFCGPIWPSGDHVWVFPRVYVGVLTFFSYILPVFVIALTYLRIARKIDQSSKFIKKMKLEQNGDISGKVVRFSSMEARRLNQHRRAKKLLTPLVVVFAVTMLPLNMLRLAFISWPAIALKTYYQNLLYVVVLFIVVNSSANPAVYSLVSKDFRKGLKNILCQGRDISCNFLSRSWRSSDYSLSQKFPFEISAIFKVSGEENFLHLRYDDPHPNPPRKWLKRVL